MKKMFQCAAALLLLSTLNLQLSTALAQGTAFTYQGQLNNYGSPANGSYDLAFTIYDSTNINGNLIAGPLTNSAIAVSNGLFVVTLDFGGGVFSGPALWLEIGVRTNGGSNFITLSPRQPLTAVPYAVMANSASNLLGTLPATQLTGALPVSQVSGVLPAAQLPTQVLTNHESAVVIGGTFVGNGSSLTNINAANVAAGGSLINVSIVGPTNNTLAASNITVSAGQLAVNGSNTPATGILIGSGSTAYQLTTDPVRVPNVPVAVLQPTNTNSCFVLDLWPTSTDGNQPTNDFEGNVKIDLVDRNLATSTDSNTWVAFVYSIATYAAFFGTHSSGNIMPPPVTFWGPNTGTAFIFSTQSSNETQQASVGSITGEGDLFWGTNYFFDLYAGVGLWIEDYSLNLANGVPLNWYNSGLDLCAVCASLDADTTGLITATTNLFVTGYSACSNRFVNYATNGYILVNGDEVTWKTNYTTSSTAAWSPWTDNYYVSQTNGTIGAEVFITCGSKTNSATTNSLFYHADVEFNMTTKSGTAPTSAISQISSNGAAMTSFTALTTAGGGIALSIIPGNADTLDWTVKVVVHADPVPAIWPVVAGP
jgi:hypothetical protein